MKKKLSVKKIKAILVAARRKIQRSNSWTQGFERVKFNGRYQYCLRGAIFSAMGIPTDNNRDDDYFDIHPSPYCDVEKKILETAKEMEKSVNVEDEDFVFHNSYSVVEINDNNKHSIVLRVLNKTIQNLK
jgi:hypothetical protein